MYCTIGHHLEHISVSYTAVVILLYVHHIRDSYIFVAEVTGQNFIDEDSEGEKANHVSKAKRRKTNNGLTSSNDQVMVLGKHYACRKFLELPFLLGKRQKKIVILWLLCLKPHHVFLVVMSFLML